MARGGGKEERRRQGVASRLRAFFLSCFLCGVCKCSSDQDNEVYGQGEDSQEVEEEPMASCSWQDEPLSSTSWEDDSVSFTSWEDDLMSFSGLQDEHVPLPNWQDEPMPSTSWQDEPMPSTSWQDEPMSSTSWQYKPLPPTNWQWEPMPSTSCPWESMPSTSCLWEPMLSTSWQEESMASTSWQKPQVPQPPKRRTRRRRWRFRRRRKATEEPQTEEPEHIRLFGDPCWLARVWARVRQFVSDYRQRHKATEDRIIEAATTMTTAGRHFSKACVDNTFYRRRRERRRKARLLYRLRLGKIIAGNKTWATLPLRRDDAPRKVTFKEPFPLYYPQKFIFCGDLPWLRETEFPEPRKLWIVPKEGFVPDTASVDTLMSSDSETSQVGQSQSKISLLDHTPSESSLPDDSLSETSLLDVCELETSGPRTIRDTLQEESIPIVFTMVVCLILWLLWRMLCYIQELITPGLPCPF